MIKKRAREEKSVWERANKQKEKKQQQREVLNARFNLSRHDTSQTFATIQTSCIH